jgi:DNA-binding transcriptional LysR family regulator
MEQLQPNDLLIYAKVAQHGSFSRAAAQLGMPKSTVSRRVAALEERLGERLMVRTTRRLSLTEFGEQLLAHARQVADETEAVAALSEHRQAQPSGRLRVSMPSDLANLVLPDMLAAFAALHPAVSLELDLSPRRVDLIAENFDLALRMGNLPDDASLAARKVGTLAMALYASPGYLAARDAPADPDDLARHDAVRMYAARGEPRPWTLVRGERRWSGVPPGRIAANSPELLMLLACGGSGIVALPDPIAAPKLRAGMLRRVLPDWRLPSVDAWAVFPGRRLMPAKTRAFIEMLQAALAGRPQVHP